MEAEKMDDKALIKAILCDDKEYVKQYLEDGFRPCLGSVLPDPVCVAAEEGHVEILNLLLQHGLAPGIADTNDPPWHRQPIHLASAGGHTECVRILLRAGVGIDDLDQQLRTPLHWAAGNNQLSVAKLLLESGCSVDMINVDHCEWSPLYVAACLGYEELCKLLLDNGAKPDIGDREGWTPLHSAACLGHQQCLIYLIQGGAEVDKVTNFQQTALQIASGCGHVNIIKTLLHHGADLNYQDMEGCTAFQISIIHYQYEAGKCLASANADVNTVSVAGNSPLYLAAITAQERFLRLILSVGVDFKKESWLTLRKFPPVIKAHPHLFQLLNNFCTNPRTLKHLSALAVRKMIRGQNFLSRVQSLEIPDILKDYTVTLPFLYTQPESDHSEPL